MIATMGRTPHLGDGDLVRYLDREVSGTERRGIMSHLSGCDTCVRRLQAFDEQSAVASGFLAELGAGVTADAQRRARALAAVEQAAQRAPRTVSAGSGLQKVAAAVAMVVLAGISVEPLRAWMVERWSELVGNSQPAREAAAPPAPVLDRGSMVFFEPAGDVFVLELENLQASGSVTVEVREVTQASAMVTGTDAETIVVLPSGLRVENAAESSSSYQVTLPSHVRLVQVFAGRKPVAIVSLEGESLPWTRVVPLDGESTVR